MSATDMTALRFRPRWLQDQIQFLTTINNEAKTRRSTKSDILGKGRRMTYEDLEQARIKRKQKEDAKEAKGSRDLKVLVS